MKYLSVCSGIEAASVAWHSLGWEPLAFSEIEPFPRAVLAHHYPDVPCHGDFTVLRDQPWIVDADVLVGGTPCQAFSVAGLRKSLDDDRGNLSLEFVRLADAIDTIRSGRGRQPAIIVWENVPGVLSVRDNAFGCFLAALAGDVTPIDPPRGKWSNAGVVDGPARTVAWRVLDAQYFGLAQRRRRVFVVASARDGFDPAAVLLEFEGVRRDTPPGREKREAAPSSPARRAGERSHWDGVEHPHPTLNQSHNTGGVGQSNQELFSQRGAYLVGDSKWPADIAPTLNASFGEKQGLEDQHIRGGGLFVPADFPMSEGRRHGPAGFRDGDADSYHRGVFDDVAHTLKAEGFDASEDGTGRGTPLVPVAYRTTGNDGCYETGDLVHALTTATDPNSHVIGFSAKDHGADATIDLSPTLRAMPHNASHANGGGQMAVAVSLRGRDGAATAEMGDEVQNCLRASQGGGDKPHVLAPCVAVQASQSGVRVNDTVGTLDANYGSSRHNGVMSNMAVRRLTPVECERLQGFPDGYTMIPWKKKPAEDCPDGPRYKALGNSMAVPVMRWIGQRIAQHLRGEI